jgi:16S rRNA (cytidine1402-2'-O)-methyltransferase
LVTDAGMPGISDPGFRLISLAIEKSVPVVPIPGASAFLSALVASGLPTDSFRFNGFLPAKRGERRAALEVLKSSSYTQVFYEAPHRLIDSLTDVVEALGAGRRVAIAREVTKVHEEFLRGPAGEVLETLRSRDAVKGEITLLIGKAQENEDRVGTGAPSSSSGQALARPSLRQRVQQIMSEDKVEEKTALKKAAKERGISKSEAYRELQRLK